MENFNSEVYKAWCAGRCAGGNHIPYSNTLLASTVDKNDDDNAMSQIRVDDDTTRSTIQKESDETQTKLDTLNNHASTLNNHASNLETKLDRVIALLETIATNTTPKEGK